MRKALVVGIDYYNKAHIPDLHGCVNDAHNMKSALERHADGTVNFSVKILTGTGPRDEVNRSELRAAVEELFADDSNIALFYFAGHGYIDTAGGYLLATDSTEGHDGLALSEILTFANKSRAKNKVIVLDSCHSGIAGARSTGGQVAELSEGMTVLTASTADQYASEKNGSGVFTNLFIDALNGSAANLVGEITPGSIYAHIDQSLGPWEQRPVFKTNVKSFVSLRKTYPPIEHATLLKITDLFPTPNHQFALDPSFEPERSGAESEQGLPVPDPVNVARFRTLQKYNRINLVVPVDAPHMWHAAMQSKSCKLTVLGEHYWNLVDKGRI